jgi:hypothetical protein
MCETMPIRAEAGAMAIESLRRRELKARFSMKQNLAYVLTANRSTHRPWVARRLFLGAVSGVVSIHEPKPLNTVTTAFAGPVPSTGLSMRPESVALPAEECRAAEQA